MRVENPAFDSSAVAGSVRCTECPFAEEDGFIYDEPFKSLCDGWGYDHDVICPTAETYEEACRMAEEASS